MAELKPIKCPFCGTDEANYLDIARCYADGTLHVICLKCGACGPEADKYEHAIDAWNKRS